MRLVLVCAFTVFTSLSAGAHSIQHEAPSLPSAPAELLGADASGLTEKIGQALLAELGVPSLQSFQVHWNSPDFPFRRGDDRARHGAARKGAPPDPTPLERIQYPDRKGPRRRTPLGLRDDAVAGPRCRGSERARGRQTDRRLNRPQSSIAW